MQLKDPIKLFKENRHLVSIYGIYVRFIYLLKPKSLMTKNEIEILDFVLENEDAILKHFDN
jgi:hypothetical protein